MPTEANQRTPLLAESSGAKSAKPPVSRPRVRRRRSSFEASTYNSTGQLFQATPKEDPGTEPGLSLLQILALTLCMAGVQFTCKIHTEREREREKGENKLSVCLTSSCPFLICVCVCFFLCDLQQNKYRSLGTVELSYGTPYLLSLNLSKDLTALVWLAGPLSGLIVQPVIGAFSDKCNSRFGKRRPFIVMGGILTCVSMIGVAYAKEIGAFIAIHLYPDATNDKLLREVQRYSIVVAVTSFYFLDFTLNAVQAICRALILDIPPLWQQDYANAWSARMSNLAMVIGYFVGFLDLVKYCPWLGDSQIKAFCVVAIVVFLSTLAVTCVTTDEKKLTREEPEDLPWYHTFLYIWRAFRFLPRPIQTLCNTQFFAWMGWFPFLFYSTQWVSDLYFVANPPQEGDDWAEGTRAGSFALLCYSIVSVFAGIVVPDLSSRFEKVKLFSLLNIYTASHLIVAGALLSAWFVRSVTAATVILAIMGIPWAIVLWVPFSLVGEYVSFEDERRQIAAVTHPASSSTVVRLEDQKEEFDAGMILGVHNMYIVFPQFAVAIISSAIFAAADSITDGDKDSSSIAPVLAFGGLMAIVAAGFSRYIIRVG
ncbi:major facilitator superfamily domain-containing protein [Phycomyces nitens]|nr:major facilitator superfamily domain-containing protein [Phycomyces nitens]